MARIMTGIVRSGAGIHNRIIRRDSDLLADKIGFIPHPGTLNVNLTAPLNLPAPIVVNTPVYLYPILFNGTQAYIINRGKPRPDGKKGLAEIISPVFLRSEFDLKDGDIVTIEVVK